MNTPTFQRCLRTTNEMIHHLSMIVGRDRVVHALERIRDRTHEGGTAIFTVLVANPTCTDEQLVAALSAIILSLGILAVGEPVESALPPVPHVRCLVCGTPLSSTVNDFCSRICHAEYDKKHRSEGRGGS